MSVGSLHDLYWILELDSVVLWIWVGTWMIGRSLSRLEEVQVSVYTRKRFWQRHPVLCFYNYYYAAKQLLELPHTLTNEGFCQNNYQYCLLLTTQKSLKRSTHHMIS